MKRISIKITLGLLIIVGFSWSDKKAFAQELKTPLQLGVPVESQMTDRKTPKQLTVQLLANQTAKVEVEQTGMDVSLIAYAPDGEKIIEWGFSLGRFKSESILILAEKAGEYRIDVISGNRHARLGKFVAKLTELRETTEEDRVKDKAAKEISRINPEAFRLARLGIGSSRRKSLELYEEIVQLARIKKDKIAETRALHAMGNLHFFLFEPQKYYENSIRVLKMWRDLGNKRYESIVLSRIGNFWHDVGEYEKAISYYQKSKAMAKDQNRRFDVASSTGAIGAAYLDKGQPEIAIKYIEEALQMYVAMKVAIREAQSRGDLGLTFVALGDSQKANTYFTRALKIYREIGYRHGIASVLVNLADIHIKRGEYDLAIKQLSESKSISEELGSQQIFVRTLYHLAVAERSKGNLNQAIENLEAALQVVEKNRGDLRNQRVRLSFFSTVQKYYELYTDLLIERFEKTGTSKDISLAFEASERSRSRSLVDLLRQARVKFNEDVNQDLLEKRGDLNDQLSIKYRMLERLKSQKAKQTKIDEVTEEISSLDIEIEKNDLRIQSESPQYTNLTSVKTLTTKEIQNLLDDRTVLLEYKLGEKRSHLWFVSNNSIKHFVLPRSEQIYSEARTLYSEIVRNGTDFIEGKDREQLEKRLYQLLIGKVEKEIKGKRVAIVADGMLQYLPFSALQDSDSNYLVDKSEIVMLPSASVLGQIRGNSFAPNSKTIAVFADPVFDKEDPRFTEKPETVSVVMGRVTRDFRFGEKLPRLLASRQEARSIYSLVGKKKALVRTDFDASVKKIEATKLKDYRILHFATHGLLNTKNPELSGLVFSLYDKKGKSQDGFMSLNDIYNLDLASDMIVLSACQTALGKDVKGEGLIGMSRGFLYAGSKRIVASLWKVDDAATAEFMKRFYKNHLQKGMSASKALQQTKIEMKKIRRYKSPYFWSAFTLLGDWK